MTVKELLHRKLKEHGYSTTTTRLAVFRALEDTHPLSMSELVQRLEKSVNRASIYRTIDLYEKLGIVQRLNIGWKYKLELSNEFQDHHHHLICTACGRIKSFQEPANLNYMLEAIAQHDDFLLQNHQLELQGLCKNCQKS